MVRAAPQMSRQSAEPPWIKPRKKIEAKPPASQVTEIPGHPLVGLKAIAGQGAFLEAFISLDGCLVLLE